MGGIVDDICDGSVDPARSAECLASSGFGGCAHSAGELFHCLVPILHHQTRQNGTASLKGARGSRNLLGRSVGFFALKRRNSAQRRSEGSTPAPTLESRRQAVPVYRSHQDNAARTIPREREDLRYDLCRSLSLCFVCCDCSLTQCTSNN